MSSQGPFEFLPNEVIRHLFTQFSFWKQLAAILRVNKLWHYLGCVDGLIEQKALEEEYPFLMKLMQEKEPAALKKGAYIVKLFEKQSNIYLRLAQRLDIPRAYLQPLFLSTFCDPSQDDENNQNFDAADVVFLKALAVASDTVDEIASSNKITDFLVMAEIGNLSKLKVWHKKYEATYQHYKSEGLALLYAAKEGHLKCVKYLIETCGERILAYEKGTAFDAAAKNGHLDCVTYLIKEFKEDLPDLAPQHAFALAAAKARVLENNLPSADFDHPFLTFMYARKSTTAVENSNENQNLVTCRKRKSQQLTL